MKFGAELNSEPTAAAITMALGYPADIVKNVRDVRLILGKTRTLSDFKLEWESYYRRDTIRQNNRIERFIKESGVDLDGNNYIVFREALVEARPRKVDRLGGWSYGDLGHDALRELRGLLVVQLWLNNVDMKEFDNNRLLITKNGRAHSIADLGSAFGGLFLEKPELFPTTMVEGQSKESLTFRYRTFQSNSMKHSITYEDARWASRQIAQLTRSQILTAVDLGKWPACITDIYFEKLLARRNDLVRSFDLVGERGDDGQQIALIPVDLSPERISYDLACDDSAIEQDFTSDFDFDLDYLLKPFVITVLRGFLDIARGVLNDAREISIGPSRLGLSSHAIAEVLFNVKRAYERNPTPTSEQDLYIFQDHFEIGLRLGASFGVFKDATNIRRFSVSYPVRSVEEGRLKDYFIADLLLPLHVSQGKLPAKYVLLTEHYIEHATGIEVEAGTGMAAPNLEAKVARVLLLRSFLDHRDPERYILYRDRSRYTEVSLELYARIGLLELPVLGTLR